MRHVSRSPPGRGALERRREWPRRWFQSGPRYLILVESLRSSRPRAWIFYPSSDEAPAYVMCPGGVGSEMAPLRWDAWHRATSGMERIILEATGGTPSPTTAGAVEGPGEAPAHVPSPDGWNASPHHGGTVGNRIRLEGKPAGHAADRNKCTLQGRCAGEPGRRRHGRPGGPRLPRPDSLLELRAGSRAVTFASGIGNRTQGARTGTRRAGSWRDPCSRRRASPLPCGHFLDFCPVGCPKPVSCSTPRPARFALVKRLRPCPPHRDDHLGFLLKVLR
jgi:hypothetical protein